MKTLTFADAYGLGLIAKNPEGRAKILHHLSPAARKIADAMSRPEGRSSREAKSAAKELQKRVKAASQR